MKNSTAILIVGLVLVICLLVLNKPQAHAEFDMVGKYQVSSDENGCYVLDTADGFLWRYHWTKGWEYLGRPQMSDIPIKQP